MAARRTRRALPRAPRRKLSRIQTRTVDVRTVTRRVNPRRRRAPVHTAAFDRCAKEVYASRSAVNPFAVCSASLGERGILKGHRRRARRRVNPRPRTQYLIAAAKGKRSGLGFAGDRLTTRRGEWVRFPSRALAARFARHLKRHYALKGWRLRIVPAA